MTLEISLCQLGPSVTNQIAPFSSSKDNLFWSGKTTSLDQDINSISICRVFLYALTIKGKPTPVSPVIFAFTFTTINGYLQGRYLSHYLTYDLWWFVDPRFIVGHLLFLFGMAANIHSDTILRGLRKPGEKGYKIPYGRSCL